jgi:hypothetical protein
MVSALSSVCTGKHRRRLCAFARRSTLRHDDKCAGGWTLAPISSPAPSQPFSDLWRIYGEYTASVGEPPASVGAHAACQWRCVTSAATRLGQTSNKQAVGPQPQRFDWLHP